MTDLFQPTLEEQISEVEREITYRRRVYERLIETGKMERPKAERHIDIMRAVKETLEELHRARSQGPESAA